MSSTCEVCKDASCPVCGRKVGPFNAHVLIARDGKCGACLLDEALGKVGNNTP